MGRQGEHRERPLPPRNGKNSWRKRAIFVRALFLARIFPKFVNNSIFYWISINNFRNFPKILSNNCVFRRIERKFNGGVIIVLENRLKECVFAIFFNLLKFFKISLSLGTPPLDLLRCRPLKCHLEQKSWRRRWIIWRTEERTKRKTEF